MYLSPQTKQIRWPEKFRPGRAPIHVRNEIAVNAPPAVAWSWLVRAADWPRWYANAQDVRIDGGGPDLTPNATFHWRTFGVKLVSHVVEFVAGERIAWEARAPGVLAYHAWLISPTPDGCSVLTEETQYGLLARLGSIFMPTRMHTQHQLWLEGLARKCADGPPK